MKRITTLLLLAIVIMPAAWSQTSEINNGNPVCKPAFTGHPCKDRSKEPSLNLGVGNPIHLISGNKYQEETDLPFLPSGLELTRYYNSLSKGNSLLGKGWSHSYDTRLYFAGNKLQIIHADGTRTLFQARQDDTAHAVQASQGKLLAKDNVWHWELGSGFSKIFNQHGRLIQVNLPGLEPIRIIRDERPGPTQHAILEVQAGLQHKLVFNYEIFKGAARLSRIDTHVGTFHYQHEQPENHTGLRLVGMQRPDKMGKVYAYEAQYQHGNPFLLTGISMHDHTGQKAVRTNSWAYDEKGLAIRSITGGQEDTNNRIEIEYISRPKTENVPGLTRVKNNDGKHTDFHTSIKGGKYVLEAVKGTGCHGCAIPGTQAEYDSKGRMTSLNGTRIHYDENDNIRQLDINRSPWPGLQLHYDAKDRPITWSSKITGAEHTRYNDRNLPVEQKFANGDRALFEYDKDGHLVKVMESTKNKARSVTTKIVSQPKNNFFAVEYSDENNVEKKVFFTLQKNTLNINTSRRPIWVSANRKGIEDWMPSIRYDDEYIFENEGKTKIHHLPEGGYISYFYNENNKPETIIWTEQSGKKHHLILDSSIPEKGYVLGNQLAFHALKTDAGQTQLSLWNKDKRFWTQTLDFSEDNTLRSETVIVPDAKYEAGRNYAYDPSQRMISTKTSTQYKEQDLSGLHHYAWNKDGSSAAYFNGRATIKPAIERDASGLPIKTGELELEYGPNRKLNYITKNKAFLAAYFYDAHGQRTIKTTPDAHTHYYYDENHLLVGEWTIHRDKLTTQGVNDNISRRYIYAGKLPVAFIDYEQATFPIKMVPTEEVPIDDPRRHPHQSKLYFIHTDHIGQPFMVTDQEQKIHWLAHNSPTGESHILHADIEFNLRLPGQYYDQETGWHYNLHRYYDPAAGHYLEPDPIGPAANNDPFGYAAQQPRRFTDPLGLLLFSFDGTNNDKYTNTNVRKFERLYDGQLGSYIEGSGALTEETNFSNTMDLLAATKTQEIVNQQFYALLNHIAPYFYVRGDATPINEEANTQPLPFFSIDVVGFSRGATFALIFANKIADNTDKHGLFSYPFRDNRVSFKLIQACLDLRFIGLFDNVPQLGNRGSRNHKEKYSVPEKWTWVAHAVALHEFRELFPVTLLTGNGRNYIEQGFIGAHSDIGGIRWDSDLTDTHNPAPGRYSDLGDIALAWIHWQATQAGVPLKPLDTFKSDKILSQNFQSIDTPFMHGAPDNGDIVPNRDRHIQTAGHNERNWRQASHPYLGEEARIEMEHFIRRIPEDPNATQQFDFFGLEHRIVGEIDVPAYKQWLKKNLDWDAPF
ncbi:MAG: DUF6531 domain-containing protein [Advenella sp.]|uniref:DUF6531 domain-containing protein n=1 Tax=Advenella sp. TaxID=1872388 RepID=UPI0025835070|nr:DUF6531 domain-containing protein [Advenella sp.]MDD3758840.1 DUF6531 domain-containing protein [Advenella sp.]